MYSVSLVGVWPNLPFPAPPHRFPANLDNPAMSSITIMTNKSPVPLSFHLRSSTLSPSPQSSITISGTGSLHFSSNAEVLHFLPPPLHSFRATRRFCTTTTSLFKQRGGSAPSTTSTFTRFEQHRGSAPSPPPPSLFRATQRFCIHHHHLDFASAERRI